jgi:hypothetical protein
VADIFGSGGGERTAITAGISFLGKIPFDPQMVKCSDAGVSYQDNYADSSITQAYTTIAENIVKRTE